jgi:cytoskeleton protein RodZ
VAEVAVQLRLSERLVRALEQEELRALPAPVFVRGHLRNYTKLLGIAPEELLAAYPLPAPPALGRMPQVTRLRGDTFAGHQAAVWQGMNLFLLMLVVGLPLTWWYGEIPGWLAEERLPQTASLPSVARGLAGSQMPTQMEPTPVPVELPMQTPLTVTSPLLAPNLLGLNRSSPEPLAGSTPAEVVQDTGLVLDFAAKTWVEVRDTKGVRVLRGTFKAGTQQTLTGGSPPYTVSLKPAAGVSLRYHGQPVAVPSAKPGQRVRVQVGS